METPLFVSLTVLSISFVVLVIVLLRRSNNNAFTQFERDLAVLQENANRLERSLRDELDGNREEVGRSSVHDTTELSGSPSVSGGSTSSYSGLSSARIHSPLKSLHWSENYSSRMPAQKSRSFWKFVIIGWSLYALFMTTQSYVVSMRSGRTASLTMIAVSDGVYAIGWMLFTPLVLWLARRFPLTKSNLRTTIPIHLGASLAIALIQKLSHSTIVALYRNVAEGYQINWNDLSSALISYFDYGIPLYWILILLNYAFDYYGRYKENEIKAAQLESQLAQAQLQALKMQLHPHFLFNTLNAISVLIQNNPELARRTVGRLSELLRYTLDNVGVQKVSLREELEFLDRYLQIEQTRFGERLSVKTQVDDETLDAVVPNMILQPLVENAIKHGISKRRGDAQIEVSAVRENGSLKLSVKDNGAGLSANGEKHEGVGLSSTRARLKELYGERQSFALECVSDGGALATVVIPFETL